MSGRRSRELRQLSGYVKPSKTPTPVEQRSHCWRSRWNADKNRTEIRPTQLAVQQHGFKDLGWQPRSKYYTLTGKVRKEIYS